MRNGLRIGVAIPAYNEEKLITRTITTLPEYVDEIVVVNDGSKDNTLKVIQKLARKDPRVRVINNVRNSGIGYSLKEAIQLAGNRCDRVAVMAGDAQMDPSQLEKLLDSMNERGLDFIKANRFMHFDALIHMPSHRRFGNIVVTILTKFATGYYSIFDTQNGYVVYSRSVIERMPWHLVGNRYEFENTILIGLAIINAKIGDYPIPAIYGEERSTIKLLPTTMRVLNVLQKGFWQRIYYKYILYGFHPIALFIFVGCFFLLASIVIASWELFLKIFQDATLTTGTVMLFVLPFILSIQILLTAMILDVIEENKG